MMRFARYGSSVEVILDPVEIRKLTPMPALIEALATAFWSECTAPPRTIVAVPGGVDRLLASMPAFDDAGAGAVKLATLYPGNASVGLPTVQAVIVLFSANGTPEAIVDGTTVTRLRTGAASALASRFYPAQTARAWSSSARARSLPTWRLLIAGSSHRAHQCMGRNRDVRQRLRLRSSAC